MMLSCGTKTVFGWMTLQIGSYVMLKLLKFDWDVSLAEYVFPSLPSDGYPLDAVSPTKSVTENGGEDCIL
jgi:hypothetical protein